MSAGVGDLSALDSAAISAPRIDQLTAEGMKFNEFYVPSSVCSPSRAGLLTGRHGVGLGIDHVFMYNAPDGIDASAITMAEQLRVRAIKPAWWASDTWGISTVTCRGTMVLMSFTVCPSVTT